MLGNSKDLVYTACIFFIKRKKEKRKVETPTAVLTTILPSFLWWSCCPVCFFFASKVAVLLRTYISGSPQPSRETWSVTYRAFFSFFFCLLLLFPAALFWWLCSCNENTRTLSLWICIRRYFLFFRRKKGSSALLCFLPLFFPLHYRRIESVR